MAESDFLQLKNISKSFGNTEVIHQLNFSIKKGTMVTLLGPSGCGKTTVLRLIAGLERQNAGQIFIDGNEVSHCPIQQRDIGIVFQSYALFPHLSIGENVGYGLKMQGIAKDEYRQRVKEALALVDLAGFEDRYVDQISGGQQQRVALARALILKPKLLLFDEPLSNLDTNLRRALREKIRQIQQRLKMTAVYVTHDQAEAFAVSDQIIVMNQGKICQQGTAQSLYRQPNSLFIAKFMGDASIFAGKRCGDRITLGSFTFFLKNSERFQVADGDCLIGIRPEAIFLKEDGEEARQCRVQQAVYMGSYWEVSACWQGQEITLHLSPEQLPSLPSPCYLHFHQSGIFLLQSNRLPE